MKEFMNKYNGFGGWGKGNDFENSDLRIYHFEDKGEEDGFAAFLTKDDIWGNDKQGNQWVEEQKKRKQNESIFQPGKIDEIPPENAEDDQIVYIEPSRED